MKEFIEQIAAYGPRFLTELTDVVSGPKRFVRQLELRASDAVARALTFYVLCLAVSFLLELPFSTGTKEFWILFAVTTILFTTGSLLLAATYKVSFLCVRGKGSFRDHVLVTLYVSGPFYILWALLAAATKGTVLVNAPDLYPLFKEYMDSTLSLSGDLMKIEKFFPLYERGTVIIALALASSIFVVWTIWFIVCWGSYRYINGIGRLRSALAFVVAAFLSVPVSYILVLAQRGLGVNLF